MGTAAAYDDIADWYETEFLSAQAGSDPIGVRAALRELLGTGSGVCLEVGCGTGTHAAQVRAQGWTPVGVDLSGRMLAYAAGRLPVARADVARLPVRDASVPAVAAVMVHTDMAAYPRVLREVARVLRPGGVFVHVGVHPCFCGGFADRTAPDAVVIRPGYLDGHWTTESWTDAGVRARVGAHHWPLAGLLAMFGDAGLIPEAFHEGGSPTPTTFSVRLGRPLPGLRDHTARP